MHGLTSIRASPSYEISVPASAPSTNDSQLTLPYQEGLTDSPSSLWDANIRVAPGSAFRTEQRCRVHVVGTVNL
jgi:hypothetical protein